MVPLALQLRSSFFPGFPFPFAFPCPSGACRRGRLALAGAPSSCRRSSTRIRPFRPRRWSRSSWSAWALTGWRTPLAHSACRCWRTLWFCRRTPGSYRPGCRRCARSPGARRWATRGQSAGTTSRIGAPCCPGSRCCIPSIISPSSMGSCQYIINPSADINIIMSQKIFTSSGFQSGSLMLSCYSISHWILILLQPWPWLSLWTLSDIWTASAFLFLLLRLDQFPLHYLCRTLCLTPLPFPRLNPPD